VEDRRGKHVLATYCKNPRGCGGIVLLADDADYSEACCSLCATTFCAACDLPPHAPATCDMVRDDVHFAFSSFSLIPDWL
jgi:hypothetical protein